MFPTVWGKVTTGQQACIPLSGTGRDWCCLDSRVLEAKAQQLLLIVAG